MLLNKNEYIEYKDFNNEILEEKAKDSIFENMTFLNACDNIACDLIACYEPSINIDDMNIDIDDNVFTHYREIATNALVELLLDHNFGAFDHQGNFLNDGDLELCSEYVTNKCIAIAKQYL